MSVITEAEFSAKVEQYIEEIRDLKSALKYATAMYHGNLLKIWVEEKYCPVCGTTNLLNRKDTIPRQESGSVADKQVDEAAATQ